MRTRDFWRALTWAEKNESHDELANYYFRICVTIGTFIAKPNVPYSLMPLEHFDVEDSLYALRDSVAKTILQKIKGQRI